MTTPNHSTAGAAIAALAIGLALGGTAIAQPQSGQEHGAHHPGGAAAPAAPPPGPAQGPRGGTPGMMGGEGGMPMQGMSGQGGAPGTMGGDMGRMMQMMQRMMATQGGMGGHGAMRHFERIDAHLAYARTALGVTEAQAPQWNAFADAARAAADKLRQAYARAMQATGQPAAAPAQLERRTAILSDLLDATRTVAAATGPLYAALSDEQKRAADELMAEHLRDMRRLGL